MNILESGGRKDTREPVSPDSGRDETLSGKPEIKEWGGVAWGGITIVVTFSSSYHKRAAFSRTEGWQPQDWPPLPPLPWPLLLPLPPLPWPLSPPIAPK